MALKRFFLKLVLISLFPLITSFVDIAQNFYIRNFTSKSVKLICNEQIGNNKIRSVSEILSLEFHSYRKLTNDIIGIQRNNIWEYSIPPKSTIYLGMGRLNMGNGKNNIIISFDGKLDTLTYKKAFDGHSENNYHKKTGFLQRTFWYDIK